MSCLKILDMVYEYPGDDPQSENFRSFLPVQIFNQIRIWLHTLYCPDCAQEIERFRACRDVLHEDFFPPSPGLEDSIMARIASGEKQPKEEIYAVPGGLSTRGWIIAGLIILVSMATAFLGLDFQKLAHETGMSFMLPVGITIGIVLTTYGALFIGSHLKELSKRFGL